MPISLKTPDEQDHMRRAGRLAAEVLDGEGWFRSGDEGFYKVGEDGRQYFFITGRLKELIIRGGHNIDPLTIESALYRLPEVQIVACAVLMAALLYSDLGPVAAVSAAA